MKKALVIALVAIFLLAACLAGKKIQEPEFLGVDNLNVGELSMKQSRLTADLFFVNPNKYSMQLKKAELDYFINDKKAGYTVLDTLIQVPANDTFHINVNLNIDMKNVFENVLTIFQKDKILLAMTGTVRVGRNGIFFNVPVRYTGEQQVPWRKKNSDGTPIALINLKASD